MAQEIKDGIAQALISRARMGYATDQALSDALAVLLVGKRISRWEDSSIVVFERELSAVIRRVEDMVLRLATAAHGVRSQSVVDIATSRLQASLRAICKRRRCRRSPDHHRSHIRADNQGGLYHWLTCKTH